MNPNSNPISNRGIECRTSCLLLSKRKKRKKRNIICGRQKLEKRHDYGNRSNNKSENETLGVCKSDTFPLKNNYLGVPFSAGLIIFLLGLAETVFIGFLPNVKLNPMRRFRFLV